MKELWFVNIMIMFTGRFGHCSIHCENAIHYSDLSEDKCIWVVELQPAVLSWTWAEAKALCFSYGGGLASFRHNNKLEDVFSYENIFKLTTGNLWVGAKKDEISDKWLWINAYKMEKDITPVELDADAKNKSIPHCAVYQYKRNKFFSKDCNSKVSGMICETNVDDYNVGKNTEDPYTGIEIGAVGQCENMNGRCEQICAKKQNVYGITLAIRCVCILGYHLTDDKRQCKANSCFLDNGGCEHKCESWPNGIVRCLCPKGFLLSTNSRTCTKSQQTETAKKPVFVQDALFNPFYIMVVIGVLSLVFCGLLTLFFGRSRAGSIHNSGQLEPKGCTSENLDGSERRSEGSISPHSSITSSE